MARKTQHEDVQDGGLKPVGSKPEPLVGEDRTTGAPTKRLKRVVRENTSDQQIEDQSVSDATHADRRDDVVVTEGHGAPAVEELALERAIEADEASPKDEREGAEAVDQGSHVRPVDIERAELDAASHARDLAAVEAEVGHEAFALAVTAAGDRSGDHVHAVTVAARAAREAIDAGDGNVARARAFAAVERLGAVDSPHGRTAEAHDPWTAARWAPHGDQNVPAESYGEHGVFGEVNPATIDQARGLEGDSDNEVERQKAEAGPGVSIARERYLENQAARRIASDER